MVESTIVSDVLILTVGFYTGVFLCDKAGLKFNFIAYPFVVIFNKIKNIVNKKDKTNDKDEN